MTPRSREIRMGCSIEQTRDQTRERSGIKIYVPTEYLPQTLYIYRLCVCTSHLLAPVLFSYVAQTIRMTLPDTIGQVG